LIRNFLPKECVVKKPVPYLPTSGISSSFPYLPLTCLIKEFREFAQTNLIDLEPLSLMSYISLRLFEKFVNEVEGTLTLEKIMRNAEKLKDFDLGGMKFSFDPQTRKLSNALWIDTGKPEWIKL
jgi:hypothetical protein